MRFDNGEDPVGDGARVGRARARRCRSSVSGERDIAAERQGRHLPGLRRRRRPAARPHAPTSSAPSAPMSDRRRNILVLLVVAGAGRRLRSAVDRAPRRPALGPRPQGRRRARSTRRKPDGPAKVNSESLDRRDQHHALARRHARRHRSPKSSARATTKSTSRCPTSGTPPRPNRRSARPPSCTSTTGSRTSSAPTASRRPERTARSPAAPSAGRGGLRASPSTRRCCAPPSGRRSTPRATPPEPGLHAANRSTACIYGSWYLLDTPRRKGARARASRRICTGQDTDAGPLRRRLQARRRARSSKACASTRAR